MTQFEVGDWVIITAFKGPKELCIVGQVSATRSSAYGEGGIVVENVVVRHDPANWDSYNPNQWKVGYPNIRIERLGPESAV